MKLELDRFDPLSWLEDGLLITSEGDVFGARVRPEKRNVPFVVRAVCAVTVGLSAAVGVSSFGVAAPAPVLAAAPIAPGITKEQRGDPDLVHPSYWREVGAVMANMPALPEEDTNVTDPELVDLNA